jgi:hypothetical protein
VKPILTAFLVTCLAVAGRAGAADRCDLDGTHGPEVVVSYPLSDNDTHERNHIPYTFPDPAGTVAVMGSPLYSGAPPIIGVGDFVPGGTCELLWQERESDPDNPNETIRVGITVGMETPSGPIFTWGPPRPPLPWDVAGVFDLTGDLRADVLWWNPETGALTLWIRTPNGWRAYGVGDRLPPSQYSEGGVPPATAIVRLEPNIDGPPGILWQSANGSSDRYFRTAWNGQQLTLEEVAVVQGLHDEPGWSVAAVGDFDRDGQDDVLQRRPADSTLRVCFMNGFTVRNCAALTPPTFDLPEYEHSAIVAGPR